MKKISPSMMCVEIERLMDYLKVFEEEEIDYLHIDVMDGVYVPNFTLGTDYIKQLRRLTDIPLDIHLMITQPENKLDWFDFQPGELVSVHVESCVHLQRTLSKIRETGARPMVTLNPSTPLNALDYILDDIDGVLVMTVNPGFAGQKAIPAAVDKIEECKAYLDERRYENIFVAVDGNVSFDLAKTMSANGAELFIAGSSSFLKGFEGLREGIRTFKKAIELY